MRLFAEHVLTVLQHDAKFARPPSTFPTEAAPLRDTVFARA
jgi:hypothetical protein